MTFASFSPNLMGKCHTTCQGSKECQQVYSEIKANYVLLDLWAQMAMALLGVISCVFLHLRSLGVTIWELFELGNQPYRHYSDRQVLSFAVKDQQLKLPKPLLQFPLSDRW